MKYERYKRGQIIMVNFSPSVGSETKNNHLAIVLNKNDSPNNGVLTVIPLSSKEKNYYLDLGNILESQITLKLDALGNLLQLETIRVLNGDMRQNEVDEMESNIDEYNKLVKVYTSMNKRSYAMVQNITTISKLRVLKPLNKYDPIKTFNVGNEVLTQIDNKIKQLFTK